MFEGQTCAVICSSVQGNVAERFDIVKPGNSRKSADMRRRDIPIVAGIAL
jgi:hypothetical protein